MTETAEGNGGDLTISADTINLSKRGGISSYTSGKGQGGNLTISTDSLKINDSLITSFTSGTGGGGNLAINSTSLNIKKGFITTLIENKGAGGNLNIKTSSLDVFDSSTIGNLSTIEATGKTGDITIEANSIVLNGDSQETYSSITGSNRGNNDAGNLTVISDTLKINNWATISMFVAGAGTSGTLLVDAKKIVIINNTGALNGITSELVVDASGSTGDLIIKSQNLVMHNGAIISASNLGSGQGGDLIIEADDIEMVGASASFFVDAEFGSSIDNKAHSSGKVGNIIITAKKIHMQDDAQISSTSFASANAGNIEVRADNLTMQKKTEINSESFDIGDAGIITINAKKIDLKEDSNISVTTYSSGKGGDLTINANTLLLSNSILSAGSLLKEPQDKEDINSSSHGSANAGNITIHADKIDIKEGSIISTLTERSGKGGNLTMGVNNLLLNHSFLLTGSSFENFDSNSHPDMAKSGDLTVTSNNSIRLENNSGIATMTEKANAGSITINGKANLQLHGRSGITTSVNNGKGQGGNITINSPIAFLDNSSIRGKAVESAGGNITLSGFLFQSPLSEVSASSQLSTDGKLNLKPATNISGDLSVLPELALNASEHLSDHCSTRTENHNSFVINQGGIPLSPKNQSPANFLDYLSPRSNQFIPQKNKNTHSNAGLKSNMLLSYGHTPCTQ